MFQLNAIGAQGSDRWTKSITPGTVVVLGRAPAKGWSVPWDMRISREHCEIELKNDRLYVRCLDTARNPVYRLGEASRQFTVFSGETFRIGLTTFRLDSVNADSANQYEFDLNDDAANLQLVETDRVDDDVENLRDEIASLRAQVQADAAAKRREAEKSEQASDEIRQLRRQVDALKEQLLAALDEVDRLQVETGGDVSDSNEFKALQADVEKLKEKVQSGEFLEVSLEKESQDDSGTEDDAGKKSPGGFEQLRARLQQQADQRRDA